jgi:hypothetical protein
LDDGKRRVPKDTVGKKQSGGGGRSRGGGDSSGGKGNIGRALRSVYDETLREDVPDEFKDLLGKLS